jgi:hypothetical protein
MITSIVNNGELDYLGGARRTVANRTSVAPAAGDP